MASEYPPPEGGSPPLSEHAARTRAIWNEDAPNWVEGGRAKWASPAPLWGAWNLPEEERPEGPEDEVRFYMRRGWAQRWPAEDVWVARRPPA
jgi:hypothetical protein